MATEGPTPRQNTGEQLIPFTREYPDGRKETFLLTRPQYARMLRTTPPTTTSKQQPDNTAAVPPPNQSQAVPEPPAPPPTAEPSPQAPAEPSPPPPAGAPTIQQPAPTAESARIINWQALQARLWRRREQTETELRRNTRRRGWYGALGGAALVGVMWAGSTFIYNQQTAADPRQGTIAAGQCADNVPPGSIVAARDYTLDGGNEVVDGPNTKTIIEFTRGGKVCAINQPASLQQTGNPNSDFLDDVAINYEKLARQDNYTIFVIITH